MPLTVLWPTVFLLPSSLCSRSESRLRNPFDLQLDNQLAGSSESGLPLLHTLAGAGPMLSVMMSDTFILVFINGSRQYLGWQNPKGSLLRLVGLEFLNDQASTFLLKPLILGGSGR